MRIDSLSLRSIKIPFRTTFSHSSASRKLSDSMWVVAQACGFQGFGESCPRHYVTGENQQTVKLFFDQHRNHWLAQINDLDSLVRWTCAHQEDIDHSPAAYAAVELAIIDLLARKQGITVESLLGLNPLDQHYQYTAVIGDSSTSRFDQQLKRYLQHGFGKFKIKLSGDLAHDRAKIALLRSARINPQHVRADANNLWPTAEEGIDYLRMLEFKFWAIEEPLQPRDFQGLLLLASTLNTRVILDESFLNQGDLDQIGHVADGTKLFIPNLRVSKLGGLLRSIAVANRAKNLGFDLIIGAHVGETSLLTRAGLTLARAAGGNLRGLEGGCGTHLLQHDVIDPAIMFGQNGLLTTDDLHGEGFGVVPTWHEGFAHCCYRASTVP